MIVSYKTCSAGDYHIKNGIPCQDYCHTTYSASGYTVAAVADGLGSEIHSDIGSKTAAETAVEYTAQELKEGMSTEEVLEIMKYSFMIADARIKKIAEKNGDSANQYDTTLCMAVYKDDMLYYGQSGDSGMLALTGDGEYVAVTSQQRDEEGCVYPLCFGEDYWVFDRFERPVSAVLLSTDGVWDQAVPPLLKEKEVPVNVPLLEQLLDYFDIEKEEVPVLEERLSKFWEDFPARQLDDDKTTIGLINTDKKPGRREEEYYAAPDWEDAYGIKRDPSDQE